MSRYRFHSADPSVEPRACKQCVLDSWDYPAIQFDEEGVCDICRTNEQLLRSQVLTGGAGLAKLEETLDEVRNAGKGREYDCLIGVSGGVDSTYVAWKVKEWGLRPLVVHVDNGWNAELAVSNIESIISKLGFDLYTEVLDWPQMRDLQLAFLKASVLDIDLPFDNAFMAVLYRMASKHRIKYILSGHNTATEGYLPPNFNHQKADKPNILDVHRQFGTRSIKGFPILGYGQMLWYEKVAGIRMISPLNWIDYNKAEVKELIASELGWRDYGGKHYENIFTRFYQGYILPEKFGVDKRKSHLSVLICSGQMDRAAALKGLEEAPYPDPKLAAEDKAFFIKKFGLSEAEFDALMALPPRDHLEFKSVQHQIAKLRPAWRTMKRILGKQ